MATFGNPESGTASASANDVSRRTEECLSEMLNKYRDTGYVSSTFIIVGRTGVGKSSLLEDLTGSVGHSENSTGSGTETFQIDKAIIRGEDYFIVDTPGFDPENESNAFAEIVRAIQAISPCSKVAGILYLTCINQPRFDNFDKKLLRFVHAVSGDEYLPLVTFVTTFWTASSDEEERTFQRRLSSLREEWRASTKNQLGHSYQHGRVYNEAGEETGASLNWYVNRELVSNQAKNMLHRWYGAPNMPNNHFCVPILLREMENGVLPHDTKAGTLLGIVPENTNTTSPGNDHSGNENNPASGTNPPPESDRGDHGTTFWGVVGYFFQELMKNAKFEVNIGGHGHGPGSHNVSSGPSFPARGPFTGDPHSVVDGLKYFGEDSSYTGRERLAREQGIGGVPFSADWNTALLENAQQRHGVWF